jgi:hypothetical protein
LTWFGVVGGNWGAAAYGVVRVPIVEHELTPHARATHSDSLQTPARPFTNGLRATSLLPEPFVIQWAAPCPSPKIWTLLKPFIFITTIFFDN